LKKEAKPLKINMARELRDRLRDEKEAALLMIVGAFRHYRPRTPEERDILEGLRTESGLVQKTGDDEYFLDGLDNIYPLLVEAVKAKILDMKNRYADYPAQ